MLRLLLFLLVLLVPSLVSTAHAQLAADTLLAWRSYDGPAQSRVRLYASTDEARPYVAVVQELAANEGTSSVADARHLVEVVGRAFGLDPAEVTWIFHWGAFSYAGAEPSRHKELLLRATFRRPGGRLSTPAWRVLTREDLDTLTDRHAAL